MLSFPLLTTSPASEASSAAWGRTHPSLAWETRRNLTTTRQGFSSPIKTGAAPRKQKWADNVFAFEKRHRTHRTWRKKCRKNSPRAHYFAGDGLLAEFQKSLQVWRQSTYIRHISLVLSFIPLKNHSFFPFASPGDLRKQNPWNNNSCHTSLTPWHPNLQISILNSVTSRGLTM